MNKKKIYPSNYVKAAEDDSKLVQTIDKLEDDFDYIVASLEKLDRSGAEASNKGLVVAEKLLDTFQQAISQIADVLA